MYKVYLLDDEIFILEGLRYILPWEEYGFEIVGSASNGKDGYDEIISKDIDLIVTDIMMPKMTGLELMSELKKINYDTNFIVLSAFEEFSYAKQAMSMGAENYLLKPVDIDELSQSLQKIKHKLKKKEKENIDSKILKNDLILKLITKQYDENIEKDLMELDIDISGSFYYTAILEVKDKSYNIKNLLEDIVKKDVIYCIESKSVATLIIKNKDKNSVVDLVKFIKNKLMYLTNEVVYASVGRCATSIDEINISYESAKEMHEYKMVYSELSWIRCYEDSYFDEKNINIDFENLRKKLMNKNYQETLLYVDNLFNELREDIRLKPKQIKLKAIEIFLVVYNYFNESKMMKGINIYLENLINLNTVDEIEKELKVMIKFMQSKLEQTQESISPVILKLLEHIENNYKEDLNLKEISEKLNINAIYLGQLFQKETGILFSDYINNFRINKAKQLLLDTTLKASDIGEQVGYPNKNYFYRKFKNIVGITPSEYRKINIV